MGLGVKGSLRALLGFLEKEAKRGSVIQGFRAWDFIWFRIGFWVKGIWTMFLSYGKLGVDLNNPQNWSELGLHATQ